MIPETLKITLICGVIIYFIVILFLLKKKAISLKYTLLWIFAGVAMAVMIIFPQLLVSLSHLLGITSNMNGLYVIAIAFIIMILMSLTSIVTRQNRKIRILNQTIGTQGEVIRKLEKRMEADEDILGNGTLNKDGLDQDTSVRDMPDKNGVDMDYLL